jgi:indole-3-glycerol phosphate synthase
MNLSTTTKASTRHILDEIVSQKRQEVAQMYKELPIAALLPQLATAPPVRDFLAALQQNQHHPSLIAEVKKASPSRGIIRADFEPVAIAQAYERGGAACLSVLTDEKFFQGSFNNLRAIRPHVELPLLCKEFIIDPYQVYLARTAGADAVLLIVAILTDRQLVDLMGLIHDLGMTTLVEVHTSDELARLLKLDSLRLVGINNRNLADFKVDIALTEKLLEEWREVLHSLDITVVSESGIYTNADLAFVAEAGARAVLVGESLIKQDDIQQAVHNLLDTEL